MLDEMLRQMRMDAMRGIVTSKPTNQDLTGGGAAGGGMSLEELTATINQPINVTGYGGINVGPDGQIIAPRTDPTAGIAPDASGSSRLGYNRPESRGGQIVDDIVGNLLPESLFGTTDQFMDRQKFQLELNKINQTDEPFTIFNLNKGANVSNMVMGSVNDVNILASLTDAGRSGANFRVIPDSKMANYDQNKAILEEAQWINEKTPANEALTLILGKSDTGGVGTVNPFPKPLFDRADKINNETNKINNVSYYLPRFDTEGNAVAPASGYSFGIDSTTRINDLFRGEGQLFGSGVTQTIDTDAGRIEQKVPSSVGDFITRLEDKNVIAGALLPDIDPSGRRAKYMGMVDNELADLKGALAKDFGDRAVSNALRLVSKVVLPSSTQTPKEGFARAQNALDTLQEMFTILHEEAALAASYGNQPSEWSAAESELYKVLPRSITFLKYIVAQAKQEGELKVNDKYYSLEELRKQNNIENPISKLDIRNPFGNN
jgi:hypothetical protein